jgi:3-oxoacyl-[acyl-carrier-protein] synthase II
MAAILGYGAVSSLGHGVGRIGSALREGLDGIAPIRRFDASGFSSQLGGLIPDRNAPEHGEVELYLDMTVAAAREAIDRAQIADVPRGRIALVIGTSLGEGVLVHVLTARVARELGLGGPRLTVSTACASSTNAIGMALDLLALDAADVVVAGGADVLTPLVFAGFSALGVLSAQKCAPFSEPAGTTLGEGAGFLVLGRDGVRDGAHPPRVLGYGLSTDAFHDTGPDPTGAGIARALRNALAHAGVAADEIDYVNAHGTGTRANDPAEWRAIQHVLGARAASVPVSASKSFLGHAQGAAGVLETIATLIAMEQGLIPPTQRFTTARPNTPPDVVGQSTARAARCEVAVKASAGFGGANCSIVIGRHARPHAQAVARRPVWIAGQGAVAPETDLDAILASIDQRGLDRSTRYLTAAASLALTDAGVRLRGDARDRTGLVIGLLGASQQSDLALKQTIAQHGYRGLSANLFARQVLNAAPGTCARLLGLRGMHSVISAGSAGGLAAILYAAELLATRSDVDALVAGGLDESTTLPDGAACVLLSAAAGSVRVAGWHVGTGDDVQRRALDTAELAAAERTITAPVDRCFGSALALLDAVARIRCGELASALVHHVDPDAVACSIVLVGGP